MMDSPHYRSSIAGLSPSRLSNMPSRPAHSNHLGSIGWGTNIPVLQQKTVIRSFACNEAVQACDMANKNTFLSTSGYHTKHFDKKLNMPLDAFSNTSKSVLREMVMESTAQSKASLGKASVMNNRSGSHTLKNMPFKTAHIQVGTNIAIQRQERQSASPKRMAIKSILTANIGKQLKPVKRIPNTERVSPRRSIVSNIFKQSAVMQSLPATNLPSSPDYLKDLHKSYMFKHRKKELVNHFRKDSLTPVIKGYKKLKKQRVHSVIENRVAESRLQGES